MRAGKVKDQKSEEIVGDMKEEVRPLTNDLTGKKVINLSDFNPCERCIKDALNYFNVACLFHL